VKRDATYFTNELALAAPEDFFFNSRGIRSRFFPLRINGRTKTPRIRIFLTCISISRDDHFRIDFIFSTALNILHLFYQVRMTRGNYEHYLASWRESIRFWVYSNGLFPEHWFAWFIFYKIRWLFGYLFRNNRFKQSPSFLYTRHEQRSTSELKTGVFLFLNQIWARSRSRDKLERGWHFSRDHYVLRTRISNRSVELCS